VSSITRELPALYVTVHLIGRRNRIDTCCIATDRGAGCGWLAAIRVSPAHSTALQRTGRSRCRTRRSRTCAPRPRRPGARRSRGCRRWSGAAVGHAGSRRGPGPTTTVPGAPIQASPQSIAWSRLSGFGKRPSRVISRTKASSGTRAKPTASPPDSAASSHIRDRSWCWASELAA